jgi:hypothetical protein
MVVLTLILVNAAGGERLMEITWVSYLILLLPAAILAILALLSANPVKNALFLLIQSCLIALYCIIYNDIPKEGLVVIGMIFINSVLILAGNLYIEKTFNFNTPHRPSLTVLVGIALFIILGFFLNRLKVPVVEAIAEPTIFELDAITVSGLIFIVISIVISANSMLTIKGND